MEKRKCGTSDIEIPVLGIGCWAYGGGDYWGEQSQRDVEEVVHAAVDQGINHFDTAEGYNDGRSEESLGKALKGLRDQAIISSKISPNNAEPAVLRRHCEDSLRRLQTDYIDIYYVHWPITDCSVQDAFATLMDLRDEGIIRSVSISNFGVEQMSEALATGAQIDLNQLCYNLLSRAIEIEIVPMCREQEIGIVGYMPLFQGLLTGKYASVDEVPEPRKRTRHFRQDRAQARHGESGAEQETFAAIEGIREIALAEGLPMAQLSIAWAMAKPGVTCLLVGARNRGQLAENAGAAEVSLDPGLIARLDELTQPVLDKLGANPDYWQGSAETRIR